MVPEFDPALRLAPHLLRDFWFLSHVGPDAVHELIQQYGPTSAYDRDKLYKGYRRIVEIFEDKFRNTGGPVYEHPVGVMLILMIALGVRNVDMLLAALFHDVLEDHRRSKNRWDRAWLEGETNKRVTSIVFTLTKRVESATLSAEQIEVLYRSTLMKAGPSEVLVKLADWFYNLATPWKFDTMYLTEKVFQTMHFYVPLAKAHGTPAHRLMAKYLSDQASFLNQKFDLKIPMS